MTPHATPKLTNGKGMLNVPVSESSGHGGVHAGGEELELDDVPEDATITAVDGQAVTDWLEIYGSRGSVGAAGRRSR